MEALIIERTIKDGVTSNGVHNQIIKYTIKGCETEKFKVNSSGDMYLVINHLVKEFRYEFSFMDVYNQYN